MEGLKKEYGVVYSKWYKSILGDRLMIHHDSHRGSLFVTMIIDGKRITNVFEREE